MHRIYEILFNKGNDYHKYLMCPYLQDKNFEVQITAIALGKYILHVYRVLEKNLP